MRISKNDVVPWKMKHRLKTVHVALVLCLNVGVDPPDRLAPHPCATVECWVDPFSMPLVKALETIGINLKSQYERWQPRARYKQCLDPTADDVKKTCTQLRRSAKNERVLFHYNGHGVPRPTANGELWVFNKDFTQYIPLAIFDLHHWMDSPSIYVFDCSAAGLITNTFINMLQRQEQDSIAREDIILAACQANETLPMNPIYPADLFTACLTTPIRIALKWFCEQNNKLLEGITSEMIENIPGRTQDRRTPLGELNWIFTAVTDTIAWSVLPRDLFHRLFRQDLLVASLFRNFLLADRIMRTANCTPISYPKLPATHNHPMWQSWDLAVDMCVSQIPKQQSPPAELQNYQFSQFFAAQLTDFEVWLSFGGGSGLYQTLSSNGSVSRLQVHDARYSMPLQSANQQPINAGMGDTDDDKNLAITATPLSNVSQRHSDADLKSILAGSTVTSTSMTGHTTVVTDGDTMSHTMVPHFRSNFLQKKIRAPQQLPILLQVLLSQVHRLRALTLLGKFLDMGSWAVNMALSVGIFPYVLKLLQSNSTELKKCLVFIWAKILALDSSCQKELVKDNGHIYFINVLLPPADIDNVESSTSNNKNNMEINDSQLKSLACFVLSVIMDRFRPGQDACLHNKNLLSICSQQLREGCKDISDNVGNEEDGIILQRWLLLTIAKLLQGHEVAQEQCIAMNIHQQITLLLSDPVPEIRAAAVYCLSCIVTVPSEGKPDDLRGCNMRPEEGYEKSEQRSYGEYDVGAALYNSISDGSSLVRREVVLALAQFIKAYSEHISQDLLKGIVDEHEQLAIFDQRKRNDADTVLTVSSELRRSMGSSSTTLTGSSTKGTGKRNLVSLIPGMRKRKSSQKRSSQKAVDTDDTDDTDENYSSTTSASDSDQHADDSTSLRDMNGRGLGQKTYFTLDLCRAILLLCNDPMPRVATTATKVKHYLKHTFLPQSHVQPEIVVANTLPVSPHRVTPSISLRQMLARGQSQRSHHTTSSSSSSSSGSGSGVFGLKKSSSEPNFAYIQQQQQQQQSIDRSSNIEDQDMNDFDTLPVSHFYEWSAEYLKSPILPQHVPHNPSLTDTGALQLSSDSTNATNASFESTQESIDENDSLQQLQQQQQIQDFYEYQYYISPKVLRQQRRNDKLMREAMTMSKHVSKKKLETQIGFFGNEHDIVSRMKFHPFEPLLIVSDEFDGINVWNWFSAKKVNAFRCGDRIKGRVTDFHIINEQHGDSASLLLVGSSSGNVCLYKDFDTKQKVVTALNVAPDHISSRQDQFGVSPGVLLQWQPHLSQLAVGGDMDFVKLWDMEKEQCTQTIPTGLTQNEIVTSLAANANVMPAGTEFNHCITCGTSDGSLLMFDRRVNSSRYGPVATMKEHKGWVIATQMQRINNYQVISASASGDVKFWDTRVRTSVRSFEANKGSMTALVMHDYAPLIATGSNAQIIKVLNTAGETLSKIAYHDGFLGQRIGPISSLAFHPSKVVMAAGSTDSIIALYSTSRGKYLG